MKEKEVKQHTPHSSKKESAVDRALNGAIAVLFIIALVLGYAIYVQRKPQESTAPKPTGPVEPQNATGSSEVVSSAQLTEVQKGVLVVPSTNASEEERRAYFERVDKAAKESDSVEIKDCFAEPLVLKTKKGKSVTFRNVGTSSITLSFGKEKSMSVEAGKTADLLLDFVEPEGIHTFHCENLPHPAGLFYMVR